MAIERGANDVDQSDNDMAKSSNDDDNSKNNNAESSNDVDNSSNDVEHDIDDLSSPPKSLSPEWDYIHFSEALPSLTTSAPSVKTAIQNKDPPETEEQHEDLTTSKLLALNANNKAEVGAKASLKVKKGTNTRASDDSDNLLGTWVPADGDAEPYINAAGSWADDYPRLALQLEDELEGELARLRAA